MCLAWGERTIYDYVKAHQWLQSTELDEACLGTLSVRVMGLIGGLDDEELRESLEARLEGGEGLTTAQFYEVCNGPSEPKEKPNYKALFEQTHKNWKDVSVMLEWYRDRLHYLERSQGLEESVYPHQEEMDKVDAQDPILSVSVSNTRKTTAMKNSRKKSLVTA